MKSGSAFFNASMSLRRNGVEPDIVYILEKTLNFLDVISCILVHFRVTCWTLENPKSVLIHSLHFQLQGLHKTILFNGKKQPPINY